MFFVLFILLSWFVPLSQAGSCPSAGSAGLYRVRRAGYGTGMKGAAAGMAAVGMRGFPVMLTSFVGREQAVRGV